MTTDKSGHHETEGMYRDTTTTPEAQGEQEVAEPWWTSTPIVFGLLLFATLVYPSLLAASEALGLAVGLAGLALSGLVTYRLARVCQHRFRHRYR